MQPAHVTRFQAHVCCGDWPAAWSLLPSLAPEGSDTLAELRFLLLQQQFMEALEAADYDTALQVLRQRLAPLKRHPTRLHSLAGEWTICANYQSTAHLVSNVCRLTCCYFPC